MGTKERRDRLCGAGQPGKGLLKTLLGIDAVRVVAHATSKEPMEEASALVEAERGKAVLRHRV